MRNANAVTATQQVLIKLLDKLNYGTFCSFRSESKVWYCWSPELCFVDESQSRVHSLRRWNWFHSYLTKRSVITVFVHSSRSKRAPVYRYKRTPVETLARESLFCMLSINASPVVFIALFFSSSAKSWSNSTSLFLLLLHTLNKNPQFRRFFGCSLFLALPYIIMKTLSWIRINQIPILFGDSAKHIRLYVLSFKITADTAGYIVRLPAMSTRHHLTTKWRMRVSVRFARRRAVSCACVKVHSRSSHVAR